MNDQPTSANRAFDLRHDAWGRLVFTDADGHSHTGVMPVRGFPVSDPDRWISIVDAEGRELIAIQDPSTLSAEVRAILEQDLARREFVPVIRRIVNVPPDTEPTEWEVETDRGPTRFLLNVDDDVRHLGPNRALVIDAQGIRYHIDDTRQLDPRSRRVLERYLVRLE